MLFGHTKPKRYSHMCLQCTSCTASRLVIGTVLLLTVGGVDTSQDIGTVDSVQNVDAVDPT